MEEYDDLVQEPDDDGKMDLSHRAWVTLDKEVWENSADVRVFDLSYNSINILPPDVGTLKFLVELDVSCNKIEKLPGELCLCRRLRRLRVNGNRLSRLPTDIVKCNLLEELYASENVLTELPSDIHKLATLKILHAQNNKLESVPSALGECLLLEDIDFTNNNINNIPKSLWRDPTLIMWMCRHNFQYDTTVRQLEQVNAELELLAAASEERKAGMRDEIRALRKLNKDLLDERPQNYLKAKALALQYGSIVCTLQ